MRYFLPLLLALPLEAPAQEKEILPPPQQVPPRQNLLITNHFISSGPQVGRREVWELLAVDARGMFVPRVVQTPTSSVSYYLYNGRPYPWPTTSSLPYMPYTTD